MGGLDGCRTDGGRGIRRSWRREGRRRGVAKVESADPRYIFSRTSSLHISESRFIRGIVTDYERNANFLGDEELAYIQEVWCASLLTPWSQLPSTALSGKKNISMAQPPGWRLSIRLVVLSCVIALNGEYQQGV